MKPPDYVSHGRAVWDTPEPMEDAGAVTPEATICLGGLGLTAFITGIVAWATRRGKESMTCEGCGPRCPECAEPMDEGQEDRRPVWTCPIENCGTVVGRQQNEVRTTSERKADI